MSKIITPKIRIGAAMSMIELSAQLPLTARLANVNPRKVLPASPRKILAGAFGRKL
jgi:hypothetical protein